MRLDHKLTALISMLALAAPANPAWVLRSWQSDDGLANNNVTSLAQGLDGYLWIATPSKLVRFDGVQFEGFFPRAIVPQFDRKITSLLQSRTGALWLGMDRGPVLCLKSGVIQVITNGIPDLIAESITEDDEGRAWIVYSGGRGGVLTRVDGDTAKRIVSGGGDSRSLTRDRDGRIWYASDGRVGVFRDAQFNLLFQLSNEPTRLAAARAGGVWICSGLQLFHADETKALRKLGTLKPEHPGALPTALLEDRAGAVWIGTSDSGLFRYADGQFENIPTSHRQILSLLEDREGNLWVGTGGGGLDRLQPRAIELEGVENGLPFEAVQSVCQDTHGLLWAATQNGLLACRRDGAWQTIATNADWPGGTVTCVTADRDGTVWIGTQNHKLISLRDGRFATREAQDGIQSRNIHSLLATRTGDLWIGGNAPDSLQRLRAGQLKTFQLPPEVRVIRAMAEAVDGTIWIGTSKGVLLRARGDEVVDESIAATGAQLSIRSLTASADGSLWIGYAGWGLGRLKDGHFARLTSERGLYNDQISQIIFDERGRLWLGADHGVFRIRPEEFEDVAAGRAAALHSIRYGQSDGVPSLQANFGASPGALRGADGRLWIPMRTALAVVDPAQIREELAPPAVLLKRVTVDDQAVAAYGGAAPMPETVDLQKPAGALQFPPGHRRLEFEFTALNFTAPENMSFRHRLDGFDEKWIEDGARRSASYSRLPAGNYRFHVKACNRDGVWNETGASLAFIVEPFLWQTWWFRLAVLAAFTYAVIALARYMSFRRLRLQLQRVEQQAALDKERARIARDIHDDLGCRLTKIVLLTELTLQEAVAPDQTIDRVKQISATAHQGMQSLDETVWAINPRNDTLSDLIDYIGQYAIEFLQTSGIRCTVDLPDHPPARAASAEVRHHLFMAVKEALNNVARHARATEVRLQVALDDRSVTVRIEDNGQGFAAAPDNASADGLRNMRQRMEEIDGRFQVESQPGAGTRISFVYFWPESK